MGYVKNKSLTNSVCYDNFLGSFFLDYFFLKEQIASPFLKISTNGCLQQVGKWII